MSSLQNNTTLVPKLSRTICPTPNSKNHKNTLASELRILENRLECLRKGRGVMELQKESLQGTVVDLEQLLKKVEDETREEVRLMRDSNKKLEVYRESLDSGLRLAYESQQHLGKMSQFWKQYC